MNFDDFDTQIQSDENIPASWEPLSFTEPFPYKVYEIQDSSDLIYEFPFVNDAIV